MLGIVGLPIPDEALLTLTGYLIFRGTFHAVPAYLAALLGCGCGITVSYAIGKYGGLRLLRRYGKEIGISEDHLSKGRRWFDRHGMWALPVGYFVPGIRHITAIIGGSTGLEYRRFAVLAYTGAAIWSGVFIAEGFTLGKKVGAVSKDCQDGGGNSVHICSGAHRCIRDREEIPDEAARPRWLAKPLGRDFIHFTYCSWPKPKISAIFLARS